MKKAQISGVIITVIVLLFIFMFLFYYMGSANKALTDQTLSRTQLTREELFPFTKNVEDCLDLHARNALVLSGQQGGLIYESQGGPFTDFFREDYGFKYLQYNQRNVLYNIPYAVIPGEGYLGDPTKPESRVYYSSPPDYPWSGFPEYSIPDDSTVHNTTQGFFGYNLLTYLPKIFTVNMQDQIEKYVKNKTVSCIKWEEFTSKNWDIQAGDANVTVQIGAASTIITLDYPINMTNKVTNAQGNLRVFTQEYPVRLGQMIQFTSDMLDLDVTDIAFNLSTVRAENLTFERKPGVLGLDYIFVATDPYSTILDRPYELYFALKNRPPALSLLNDTDHRGLNDFVICAARGLDSEGETTWSLPKLVIEGQKQMCIYNAPACDPPTSYCAPLNSHDPDDNEVTYSFKEDFPEDLSYTNDTIEISALAMEHVEMETDPDAKFLRFTVMASDTALNDTQSLRFKTMIKVLTS